MLRTRTLLDEDACKKLAGIIHDDPMTILSWQYGTGMHGVIVERAAIVLIHLTVHFMRHYVAEGDRTTAGMMRILDAARGMMDEKSTLDVIIDHVYNEAGINDRVAAKRLKSLYKRYHTRTNYTDVGEAVDLAQEWLRLACSPCDKAAVEAYDAEWKELTNQVRQTNTTNTNPAGSAPSQQPDNPYDPIRIKRHLDKYVTGQEEAKRSLALALSMHMGAVQLGIPSREATLLIGPTGCGKTLLARTLADYAKLPCAVVDASQLSQDGWAGMNKAQIFRLLEADRAARGYHGRGGIVMLDEFDKLCRPRISGGGENVGATVQGCILGMLDGIPVADTSSSLREARDVQYRTDDILFIMTGAFAEMKTQKEKKVPIGFVGQSQHDDIVDAEKIRDKLIRYGMIPELTGRITNISYVHDLTPAEVAEAVTKIEGSPVSTYEQILRASGKQLIIPQDVLYAIAEDSVKSGLGVRGCRNTLSEKIRQLAYAAYEEGKTEIILTM